MSLVTYVLLLIVLILLIPFFALVRITSRNKKLLFLLRITRTIIFLLLAIAIFNPTIQNETTKNTDPELLVLIDNSTSMQYYNLGLLDNTISDLKTKIGVKTQVIAQGSESPIVNSLIANIKSNQNVLLVSDGQNTGPGSIIDAIEFARAQNSSVSLLKLPVTRSDSSVEIIGPDVVLEGTNNSFIIIRHKVGDVSGDVKVFLDGKEIITDNSDVIKLDLSFSQGSHVLLAEITGDLIPENNKYYKTVTAVKKPRILHQTNKQKLLGVLLDQLYNTTHSISSEYDGYATVIIDDLPASLIDEQNLIDYLEEGNGVLFVGGKSSFDKGGYKQTLLETILPVKVGAAKRDEQGANIVVAIDMSESTKGSVTFEEEYTSEGVVRREIRSDKSLDSLQKSLAVSIIEDLNPANKLGVIGFTYPQEREPNGCTGACVIHELSRIDKQKQEIIQKIATSKLTGGTSISTGLKGANEMLKSQAGGRNVILITDGVTGLEDKELSKQEAAKLRSTGGVLYVVQVGDNEQAKEFLLELANIGGGIYFKATRANRLSLLFGEPVSIEQGDAFDLVIIDSEHFITEGLQLDGVLYGYNQVIPKTSSRLLVASHGGDPVLTVWNYGIGRVAAITGYDGNDLGSLLTYPNSELITRTINWLIGDPQRLSDYSLFIKDVHYGEQAYLNITSKEVPVIEGLVIEKTGPNNYVAEVNSEVMGLFEVLGEDYAVNYPLELKNIGVSNDLEELVRVVTPDNIDNLLTDLKPTQVTVIEKKPVRKYLLMIALIIFIIEIIIRRIWELKQRRNVLKQ